MCGRSDQAVLRKRRFNSLAVALSRAYCEQAEVRFCGCVARCRETADEDMMEWMKRNTSRWRLYYAILIFSGEMEVGKGFLTFPSMKVD